VTEERRDVIRTAIEKWDHWDVLDHQRDALADIIEQALTEAKL
jgi:hypothetical protein